MEIVGVMFLSWLVHKLLPGKPFVMHKYSYRGSRLLRLNSKRHVLRRMQRYSRRADNGSKTKTVRFRKPKRF